MNWKPISSMPLNRTVQIGNKHWTGLWMRLRTGNEEYIQSSDEDVPFSETTATHWQEYDFPPTSVLEALDDFEEAVSEFAFIGCKDPLDHQGIIDEYERAKAALLAHTTATGPNGPQD